MLKEKLDDLLLPNSMDGTTRCQNLHHSWSPMFLTVLGFGSSSRVVLVVDSHWLECILSYCPHNMNPRFGSNLL
jgi:hypothetical protein